MLDPCNPCVSPRASCEQCMFGYRSKKENHETMKKLFLAVEAGEKPFGWGCVKTYKFLHKDWQNELQKESKKNHEL